MMIRMLGLRFISASAMLTALLLDVDSVHSQSPPPTPQPPAAASVASQPAATQPGALPEDGPAYPISGFVLRYLRDNPQHPPIDTLLKTEVKFGWTYQGYVAPREGLPTVTLAIGDAANRGMETYYASAVQKILERLRDAMIEQNFMGVYIAPDPLQISDTGQDYRKPEERTLTLIITTGTVTELRTLGSGERVSDKGPIKPDDRINNPLHQRIHDRSPIQPQPEGEDASEAQTTNLLRKDLLDRYLFHLSRHPGRRVDASVAAAEEAGGVALDYQITENRPLTLYAQVSNTGTRSTSKWRERFGFIHTQLTNHDDVLSFDYITANFDDTNTVMASYEAPFENDRIRWRIEGNWSEFTAEDVGFFGEDFTGESWFVGGEIIANIYQKRELFLDLFAGARFENIQVDNQGVTIEGDSDFIVPRVGLRMDRTTEWFSTQAMIGLEWWLSSDDEDELAALGRTDPDADTAVLQLGFSHAVYLEPLLDRKAWENPNDPNKPTLAHEVQASIRGQYAFGNRLIPQAEQVVGGFYTVRGYPESIVAGDSAIIASFEYRLHVPRLLGIEAEPRRMFGRPFRFAPQYVYGTPDWDLVLKAFCDVGRTFISDRLSFERDETLVGIGIGAELQIKRNITIRLDWGFAMEDTEAGPVHSGSDRVHFSATILF